MSPPKDMVTLQSLESINSILYQKQSANIVTINLRWGIILDYLGPESNHKCPYKSKHREILHR